MLNQVVLVGRLVEIPEIKEGVDTYTITIAVPRSFKNEDGEYETDFINCILFNNIAKNTAEYCKKGDIVGIKGRIQTRTIEKENGEKSYITEIISEKLTFLSSKKEGEE